MTASQMPEVGDVVADRYELVEELGQGGFGVVYRARQDRKPREVAVKVMYYAEAAVGDAMDAQEFKKRFRREAIMASNLNHPHAVQQFDFGQDGGLFYLSQELVRGVTLKARIEQQGPLPTDLVARIGYATLDVLQLAHKKDIVHRDLKPENIMLCDIDGQTDFPKVLDFGAAKTMHGQHDLTVQGVTLGSPSYMSPEVLMDEAPRPASDIYSLGLTLGEAILGTRIVSGKTPIESLKQQINPNPLDLPPELISHPLFPWLAKALEKDAAKRYPTAGEMLDALRDLDLPGVDLSEGAVFSSSNVEQRTMQMSALSPDADAPGGGQQQSDANPATELIDLDDEVPDDASLDELLGRSGDDDGGGDESPGDPTEMIDLADELAAEESAPTQPMEAVDDEVAPTEMFDLADELPDDVADATELVDLRDELPDDVEAPTEMVQRPEDLQPGSSSSGPGPAQSNRQSQQRQRQQSTASSTSSGSGDDSFHQAKTEAIPSVGPDDQPPSQSQSPAGRRSQQTRSGSKHRQRTPSARSSRTEKSPSDESSTSDSESESALDPALEYASFGQEKDSAQDRPPTEITEIQPTADKDFMTVRTADKRPESVYMPALITGAVLLIIATFMLYVIAV